MIFWMLALCLVVPVLWAGVLVARAKPRPPAKCGRCEDGRALTDVPIASREGFDLALRCPACAEYYRAKVSLMSLKHLTEDEFRRDFPASQSNS